nr:uncharacterized protein LOC112285585 isoform X1 [Physcomitrium patens]XP_024382294.1 uncharacterized protein LOC112285585 isoform X1 [Physcomitrium patens]|eukprot:XP_024382293.1 uncharacterized protein LOC112285585 isoform X1 [Physcomitrella patens]
MAFVHMKPCWVALSWRLGFFFSFLYEDSSVVSVEMNIPDMIWKQSDSVTNGHECNGVVVLRANLEQILWADMKSVAMIVLLTAMAMAASSVHGACTNDLSPYEPCTPAMFGTAPSLPTRECCNVMKVSNLTCLCSAIATVQLPEFNQQAALMLPKRCGAVPPGMTTCKQDADSFASKLMNLQ